MTDRAMKSGAVRASWAATGRSWPDETTLRARIRTQVRYVLRAMLATLQHNFLQLAGQTALARPHPLKVDREVHLDLPAFGRSRNSAVIGAGEAAVGIAPADEVVWVVDIHSELPVEPFFDRERLAQRERLGLLRESAHPVQSRSCVAKFIERRGHESAGRGEIARDSRVEIARIGGAENGHTGYVVGGLATVSQSRQIGPAAKPIRASGGIAGISRQVPAAHNRAHHGIHRSEEFSLGPERQIIAGVDHESMRRGISTICDGLVRRVLVAAGSGHVLHPGPESEH